MFFNDVVYVGIDPTSKSQPMRFTALGEDLKLLASDAGSQEAVLAFIAGLEAAVVAVASPQSRHLRLLSQPEVRRRFNLRPNGRTWSQWKVGEYELRRRNIRLYKTPTDEDEAPGWMRQGFQVHRRLEGMGFRFFAMGMGLSPRTLIEVNPHACYTVLLERRPFLKGTLEGRLQRQLVLYLEGLDIPNPMRALEEITRHHLLSSYLPLGGLLGHDELDALIAAYTAYLVGERRERICQVGDLEEGWITLPAAELKAFYA